MLIGNLQSIYCFTAELNLIEWIIYRASVNTFPLPFLIKTCFQISRVKETHSLSFPFFLFSNSGRRWAVTMKTWTPSGRTRSAMCLTTIRTTGCGPSTSGAVVHRGSTWRWSSQSGIAVASRTYPAHAKRHSISFTMSLILTLQPELLRPGWKTPGSR